MYHGAEITSLDLQGPIFVHEPAFKVEFSNNTGGLIHCSGHANPYPEVNHSFLFVEVHLKAYREQRQC